MSGEEKLLILVDPDDKVTGYTTKEEAHKSGLLHRAFSIFIINNQRQLLLQQRSFEKYHTGGLWSNTCCSHPYKGEDILKSAQNRLYEEMGFSCPLEFLFKFRYYSQLNNDMIEHELDYVYYGKWEGNPVINRDEVANWKWVNLEVLKDDLAMYPEKYTPWLRLLFPEFLKKLNLLPA